MLKKVIGWAIVAFIVFWIVRSPSGAAASVKSLGAGIANVAARFGDFLSSLVK